MTESKSLEAGLQSKDASVVHGERRFRSIADAIPLIVWTANPNGELDYYNQQWEIYTGYTSEQTKGWGWAPVLHPDDLQRCINVWTRAYTTGEPYEIEYRFKRAADGIYRWYLGRAIPLKDEAGTIIKWLGTGTDIDDQIRAKELLNQAYLEVENIVKERTAELASANQMLVRQNEIRKAAVEALQRDSIRLNEIIATQYMLAKAVLDLDAFIELVVSRMALLTAAHGVVVELREGDELINKAATGSEALLPGMRQVMQNSLSGLCMESRDVLMSHDTENDPRVNLDLCRKINARSMVVAPLIHAGTPIGVLKIIGAQPHAFGERDIQTLQLMAGLIGAAIGHQTDYETSRRLLSERKAAIETLQKEVEHRIRMEETVRSNEIRTRAIIDSSYDAFVAMDENGVITDWNQQSGALFGWTRQEAVGKLLADLVIPPRYRRTHTEGMQRFLRTGVDAVLDRRIELVALRRSGQEFPVELTIRALQHPGGYEFCAFLRDITERKEIEKRLLYLAQNDSLTEIPNRSLFNDRIAEAMKRAQREKSLMALLYLDIDDFKSVNEHYGHKTGDELLKEFAHRLRVSVRATDTVARLGGDEFTVIMEELKHPSDAERVASKILRHVGEEMLLKEVILNVTASIGIAYYHEEVMEADQLVHHADQALYRAKLAGRNGMST